LQERADAAHRAGALLWRRLAAAIDACERIAKRVVIHLLREVGDPRRGPGAESS
jgi:hypothetical protein